MEATQAMKIVFEGAVLALLIVAGFAALVDLGGDADRGEDAVLGKDARPAESNRRGGKDASTHLVVGDRGEAYWVGWSNSCEAPRAGAGGEARGGVGLPKCGMRTWPHIPTTRQPGGGPHGAAAHLEGD